MEQCEDVLHHSQINLLCNTMRGHLHIAEATTHKPPVMQHGQSQPRLQLPCRPFAQHVLHDVDTGYATTTCEVVSAPGALQCTKWQGFTHLYVSCGVSYQEALVVGHVHCWLTSRWQILNTLYLQSLLTVTQAVTCRELVV